MTPDQGPMMAEPEAVMRALRVSEERLHTAVSSADILLWALDRDGIITFSDGKGLELLGLRPGEVVGRSVFELYADNPEIISDVHRALAGESFTSVMPVGEIIFETRYTPLRNENGEVAGTTGVAVDVTQRFRAEEERERSVSLLRSTHEALKASQARAAAMADRMHAVASAAAGVLGAGTLEALQDVLRNACRTVIPFDAFTFALYNQEEHSLTILSAYDTDILVPGNTMSAKGVPMERVIRERKSLVTLHASDPAAAGSKTMGTGRRSESIIRSPVLGTDRVLGVLSVQSYTSSAV